MNQKIKKIIILCLELLAIITVGYLSAFVFTNYRVLKNKNISGIKYIDSSELVLSNIEEKDGYYLTNNDDSSFTYTNESYPYIKKIAFNYEEENNTAWQLEATYLNIYGEVNTYKTSGNSIRLINVFAEKIMQKANSIKITIYGKDVKISNIRINNEVDYYPTSFFFFLGIYLSIFLIIKYRENLKEHPEKVFLIFSLFSGGTMLLLLPANTGISWDDQIHFANAYGIFNEYHTEATLKLLDPQQYGFFHFNTSEEIEAYDNYLNNANNNPTNTKSSVPISYNKISYIPQALILKISQTIAIPLSLSLKLAELSNLIIYILICFLAIKKTPLCKWLMVVISLLPTSIFLATNFSYDPPITGFILLGFSYLLYEYYNKSKLLSISDAFIIILSFIIASFVKAIYIPLILLLLLLPKTKFANKGTRFKFCFSIIIIFALIMATFVLPTVTNSMGGDLRGGATSVSGQLHLILKSPISFAKVFYSNAGYQFFYRLFGEQTLYAFAYAGGSVYNNIDYIIIGLLLITTFINSDEKKLTISFKFFDLLFCLGIICMIWGALYLSFTPVGSLEINGVQGRYFIPLLYPMLIIISTSKIKCEINDKKMLYIYSVILLLIVFIPIFDYMLIAYL